MDIRSKKMCSSKWLLRWEMGVQWVREINFFHSDITVILHCQKLFSYNWRPYRPITPHIIHSIQDFSC
jgi:hypothetical protein